MVCRKRDLTNDVNLINHPFRNAKKCGERAILPHKSLYVSYADDTIQATVEAWADERPELD